MDIQDTTKGVILAIDDDPDNLRLLFEFLDSEGFKVLPVQSSDRAVLEAERHQPDIILLDVLMPGMDGFEVCRHLKQTPGTHDIPIVFMTVLSDMWEKMRAFRAGAVDYITKPFHQEEVLARVNTHVTIRKLQQQLEVKNELLEQQVAQLQELNASKDKFISMISHDLQSPFSSLRGLIQFTAENLDGYDKSELENIMGLLGNSTENLYALIENLLTWSRIQRGVLEHCPQPVDIRESVIQNIDLFTQNAEEKQITLSNCVATSVHVYADYNMLNAILRNLASNALKFSNAGDTITFSASAAENNMLEIAVSDTGIGIGKEHFSKLFRIDSRYKRLGTAREKGTGLGLILCKEFVEKNGGEIRIESDAGQGTTVKFSLPKAEEE